VKKEKEQGPAEKAVTPEHDMSEREIMPERDFIIHWNHVHIELKKGVKANVPAMFLENLKTEKII
jgi:hypothetical protein